MIGLHGCLERELQIECGTVQPARIEARRPVHQRHDTAHRSQSEPEAAFDRSLRVCAPVVIIKDSSRVDLRNADSIVDDPEPQLAFAMPPHADHQFAAAAVDDGVADQIAQSPFQERPVRSGAAARGGNSDARFPLRWRQVQTGQPPVTSEGPVRRSQSADRQRLLQAADG